MYKGDLGGSMWLIELQTSGSLPTGYRAVKLAAPFYFYIFTKIFQQCSGEISSFFPPCVSVLLSKICPPNVDNSSLEIQHLGSIFVRNFYHDRNFGEIRGNLWRFLPFEFSTSLSFQCLWEQKF